jgi:hypothetical protein
MDTTETSRLCNDVEHAVSQIRTLIGDRTAVSEALDLFWFLQDRLSRLVDIVNLERGEVGRCGRVRNVMNALQTSKCKSAQLSRCENLMRQN